MDEFIYYEIGAKEATGSLRKALFANPDVRMRPNPKGGWIVRAPQPVPTLEGKHRAKAEHWESVLVAQRNAKPERRGAAPALVERRWRVEAGPRKATLARTSFAPNRTCLWLRLGDGSANECAISVAATLPGSANRLRVELHAPDAAEMRVEPSLRSAGGRLLAGLEPQPVRADGRAVLEWKLPAWDENVRSRVGGLRLTVASDRDRTSVIFHAITWVR